MADHVQQLRGRVYPSTGSFFLSSTCADFFANSARHSVLFFGPQALSFQQETFQRLRVTLSSNARYGWMLETLKGLPSLWEPLTRSLSKLKDYDGAGLIGQLIDSFKTGRDLSEEWSTMPNVVLTPFVVMIHLTHYIDYLELTGREVGEHHELREANTDSTGFCTGLLTSLAVKCSTTDEELAHYGSVAIRLAFCIGGVVDVHDKTHSEGEAQSLAVMWNSVGEETAMTNIINEFRDAYESVIYDQNRLTVTVPKRYLSDLQANIKACGMSVNAHPVPLYGRFHSPSHQENLDALLELCDSMAALQFRGGRQADALRSILVKRADWYREVKNALAPHPDAQSVCFGFEKVIPPSILRTLDSSNVSHIKDLEKQVAEAQFTSTSMPLPRPQFSDNDIAIVGMSCNFANADDTDEFWNVLCSGESQHKEVPHERFEMNTAFRTNAKSKQTWYANLLKEDTHQSFDHQFFKKSAREAASMDPQQRLILQCSYQALEQSGYFNKDTPEENVGCYIGVCATDYQHNVACHEANAYSATGNLGSFIAGKVSHCFGWTGPALVIDTACSSSAVAIHQAARAILAGDCNQAIAGGALVITSPLWFHNLAGASFLSTTGSCKPFDAAADGYCRGEGVAAILLKRMSEAVADHDQILGCIAATDVRQNENCTPIVVPNAPSLSTLFQGVMKKSGLKPEQITLAEAHGTGTPVGDPAEWDSIRKVLAGPTVVRKQKLAVGSVKGHIGHTECTSGAAAVIKVLLMMHAGFIPQQAGFSKLSPKLNSIPEDGMEVLSQARSWDAEFRAALINNYGASGSNASMIITQPFSSRHKTGDFPIHSSGIKQPFWLPGYKEDDIRRNAARLLQWIEGQPKTLPSDLSFNVSRRNNRSMPLGLAFTANSTEEVQERLKAFANGGSDGIVTLPSQARPVVLCFGGQISTYVGLDQAVYDQFKVLRSHLDACDAELEKLGLSSIYPAIFDRNPISDQVLLQTTLFALQYSCAQSWIESGITVAGVVGHSFGELTALAVCGIVSLHDAVKLVSRRATLIRDNWGSESGAMMAVEASLTAVNQLVDASASLAKAEGEAPPTIACYNGPSSFTIAGSSKAIACVARAAQKSTTSLRTKKLNVTNAFHSTLVQPLMDDLLAVTDGITFNDPQIPLIHANESTSDAPIGHDFVAKHLRNPVNFWGAVTKLAEKNPNAVFLEAGSNSTITNMASRALGTTKELHFQSINITTYNAYSNIADVTLSLWKAGVPVRYWAHHKLQTYEYAVQLLPPHQFAKTKHWLELQAMPAQLSLDALPKAKEEAVPTEMYTFLGYQDQEKLNSRFRINTQTEKYEKYLVGHIIADAAPICPATLEIDIVIEAIRALHPDLATKQYQPITRHLENQAPICRDPSRTVYLDLQAKQYSGHCWDWKISSCVDGGASTCHVTGEISLRRIDDRDYQLDFKRYERLVSHERCTALLNDHNPDDLIYGRNIYRAFGDVVDYGMMYRGVRKIVGKSNESAGRVAHNYTGETWFDAVMADCFSQVGGVFVNCMTDRPDSTIYIANAIEQWLRSPKLLEEGKTKDQLWDVFATHQKISTKAYCTDVFVFDAETGELSEVILGIHYVQVPKVAMRKLLLRNTPEQFRAAGAPSLPATKEPESEPAESSAPSTPPEPTSEAEEAPKEAAAPAPQAKQGPKIAPKLKEIIAELCGLETNQIADDAQLGDLGIDSLMAMELCKEIETAFEITIPEDERGEIVDFPGLVECVRGHTGGTATPKSKGGSSSGSSDGVDSASTAATSVDAKSVVDEPQDVKKPAAAAPAKASELEVSPETWLEAFHEMNAGVDDGIKECGFGDYLTGANLEQTKLCVLMILEAFEKLGHPLSKAAPGDRLKRVPHVPEHFRLVDYLYRILDVEGGLVKRDNTSCFRTETPLPGQSSADFLKELQNKEPHHADATQLAYYCGTRLAEVLQGKENGVKIMFGTEEGRDLVGKLYGTWPLNYMYYHRMVDFFQAVAAKLPKGSGPLKILEMGAGTAGTTKIILPKLAELGIPVEYTFTDLSNAFCAQARKMFKKYSNILKFRAHDIEKAAPEDLIGTQHIVVASNAVHATHDLNESTGHIKQFLRPDGVLLMLEMTTPVIFIDIIFGLFEGWWMFNDDRDHAISHQSRWERVMKEVGYGHVTWTDGSRPETNIERLILGMAQAPGPGYAPPPRKTPSPSSEAQQQELELSADLTAKQTVIENYVRKYTVDWSPPTMGSASFTASTEGKVVLITGATGSLGSFIVSQLAYMADVKKVICVNRKARADVKQRQTEAFESRNVPMGPDELAKLKIIATDIAQPLLGLPDDQYLTIGKEVTHICHNAWPMSAARPVEAFEAQFQVMRNLIDLATLATSHHAGKISFELVSSIAVVGQYPIWTGDRLVPEERMDVRSLIGNGYGDAKYICERMLDETLHRSERFRALAIRPGQIAGSKTSGAWNTHEHLSFLVKSCQTLQALPAFEGELSWTPVEDVAGTCVDVLMSDRIPEPIYHVDNPVRQPWGPMIELWADAMSIPSENIIPFSDWIKKVRDFRGKGSENPAIKLVDFLDDNFTRMSCGGLLLGTDKAVKHSETLASVGSVSDDVARGYIRAWQESGWLQ